MAGNVGLLVGLTRLGLGFGSVGVGVGVKGRWLKEETTLRERSTEDTMLGTRD